MTQLKALLQHLSDLNADFVLAGGIAESLYGSEAAAMKLEILCSAEPANLDRLKRALAAVHARLRGEPANFPFEWKGLPAGRCYRLAPDLGNIDVSSEITGVGGYEAACEHAAAMRLSERDYLVLSEDNPTAARRVVGRYL